MTARAKGVRPHQVAQHKLLITVAPLEALNKLPKELQAAEWVKAAKKSWKKGMGWADAMSVLGNTATVVQTVIPALLRSLGA